MKSGKGLLKFFRESIRYAYIKKKLARFGKKFKRNKSFSISRKRFILNPQNSLRPLPKHEQFLLFRLFFHLLIKHGNNRIALKILVEVVNLMKMRYGVNFFNNFVKVIEKIRPLLMYRTMYVGGKKYRIPIIIQREKSYKVGVNLLVNNSKKEINPAGRLFEDISLVVKNKGTLIKSWNDYHSLVFENKSYTRFLRFLKSGLI